MQSRSREQASVSDRVFACGFSGRYRVVQHAEPKPSWAITTARGSTSLHVDFAIYTFCTFCQYCIFFGPSVVEDLPHCGACQIFVLEL